ncbi:hypothetical protein F0562_024970 [Nyssa sinensis]|uniref:GTD-binding domain-containing protein n=1 Tax=Nyssa sinensis TaxID=561372 RepID=A0A5J5BGB7_9ASTE|nr:hypothetical protein F0562_024970 [Nyssa sinensis]
MHRKLSDIRSMCEGCLLSFATEKESDYDTYKSGGILRKDIDCFEDDCRTQLKSGRRNDVVQVEKSNSVQRCSCCGEPLKMLPSSKVMARNPSINGILVSQAPAPSPRAPFVTWKNEESRNLELPHIRYMKLKLMSDNESELPEDEDNQAITEDIKAASVPLLPESEDITPSFFRGNRFFGIPLTDSASASPRFATRLSRRLQLEKSELSLDPIEANTTNEADGDSILHHLKRQVRLDRKSLIELYMELDEERSASAVAANNAMAMITRLQAEKAAVQMEALQYQRMMEEQAEYDEEALQVMKDLLTKREEEIKALEAELETYREKCGQIKKAGSEECEIDADEDYQEFKSQFLSPMSESGSPSEVDHSGENERNSEQNGGLQEEKRGKTFEESSLDFERERSYLLGLLTGLEKKINLSSDDGANFSQSDMVKHEDKDIGHEYKAILTTEVSQIREWLRAIEADSGFLKHAAMTLQMGGEGTKLLIEIAHHLGKLRQSVKMAPEDIDA